MRLSEWPLEFKAFFHDFRNLPLIRTFPAKPDQYGILIFHDYSLSIWIIHQHSLSSRIKIETRQTGTVHAFLAADQYSDVQRLLYLVEAQQEISPTR
ncbi:hypothetical protein C8029_21695 [Roseobacter sp. TSBP12]|nr:hypothetical protein C8029_21695 [Roseobacter sp. TSBP12]